MGSWRWPRVLALCSVVLLATVLWQLPSSWATHLLPAGYECIEAEGTLWAGGCGRLQTRQFYLEQVHWTLAPVELLRGRLGGKFSIADPRLTAKGFASLGLGGQIHLRGVEADADLSRRNFPQLHADWVARVQLKLTRFDGARGVLPTVTGSARVLQAHREGAPEQNFGSYELSVDQPTAGATKLEAQLRDLAGPLALSDTHITLDGNGAYELNGNVSARPQASDELTKQLEFLGPPDNQGRRPLSVAGEL